MMKGARGSKIPGEASWTVAANPQSGKIESRWPFYQSTPSQSNIFRVGFCVLDPHRARWSAAAPKSKSGFPRLTAAGWRML